MSAEILYLKELPELDPEREVEDGLADMLNGIDRVRRYYKTNPDLITRDFAVLQDIDTVIGDFTHQVHIDMLCWRGR